MRFDSLRFVLLCGALTLTFAIESSAQKAYDATDAEYVTSSKNPVVLQYIVCLEDAVGATPRNVGVAAALAGAADSCKRWEKGLPGTPDEPDSEMIRQSIMECGFRPGDASPDANCGQTTSSGNGIVRQT